jgi:putative transposase
MNTDFCIEAVEEALAKYGKPEIFNTDQGSQFTSTEFTGLLKQLGIAISMDGKGAWRDNVFVERLCKTIKYEEVYLHAYDTVSDAKACLASYIDFYNRHRPHRALDGMTPDVVYFDSLPLPLAA